MTAPDLVVDEPTVSTLLSWLGVTLTLRATVSNQGSSAADSTTLRYYRSGDASISTSDTEVGTDAVGALGAGLSSAEWIGLAAPATAGTYYYGACVDEVTNESDTTNNCSAGVEVTVTAPDLVVDAPTVSASNPTAGAAFTLSTRVRNSGGSAAAATALTYYRSSDDSISTSDTSVGTDAVGALGAGGRAPSAISVTAPATAGTYYYGACVDAVTNESDTTNNCSAAVRVTVVTPPDLVVDPPTVSDSSLLTGAPFTLSATVRNNGGAADRSTLRYYRSSDSTISTSDTLVGAESVSGLGAGASSPESIRLAAPSSAGTYYYGACVDAVTNESDTANNCSAAVAVTVVAPPDLVVGAPTVSASNPTAGVSFTLSATVRNQGGAAGSTTLRYYRSSDDTISTSDTSVGMDPVGALGAAASSDQSINLTAPSSAGTYYYGACVDAVSDESATTNNCSVAVAVTVGAAPAPDLVVEAPMVSSSSPLTGATFTLSATVRNQGSAAAGSTTLRYYRSSDDTISTSDTSVGTDSAVSALDAGASSDQSISLTAPSSAGTYYYGACVDAVTYESDTANNCSAAVTVTVTAPDVVVDPPMVSDSSPLAGSFFTLSATVRNQGNGAMRPGVFLRYYSSTDDTITTGDNQVGRSPVRALNAGDTSAESIRLAAPSSAGTYYYGACVDAVTNESDTANNCSAAVAVTVGAPTTWWWARPRSAPVIRRRACPSPSAPRCATRAARRAAPPCATTAPATTPSPRATPQSAWTRWAHWERRRAATSRST